jgi:hypothetical protein
MQDARRIRFEVVDFRLLRLYLHLIIRPISNTLKSYFLVIMSLRLVIFLWLFTKTSYPIYKAKATVK